MPNVFLENISEELPHLRTADEIWMCSYKGLFVIYEWLYCIRLVV